MELQIEKKIKIKKSGEYGNEPREIRNHKNRASRTNMKCFGNASQDDIQKLMAKSKNKITTKVTATWRNVYHTWVKHRGEVLEIKK